MRRVGHLFDDLTSFDHLVRSARRAARGKRHVRSVAEFLFRLEPETLRLQRELRDGTWRPGTPHEFHVRDPKERLITAAPFSDRVVHHAVMDRLEPVFDRRMTFGSFACRKGKGAHRAVRYAQQLLRRHDAFLKLDVRKCFDSLAHDVVLNAVGRIVKDRRVLDLCATIVRDGGTGPDVGLPIGNLTSQWFANLVLDRLDHHVQEVLRVPGYARYMDDFVLFDRDRDRLRGHHAAVRDYLEENLRLALKDRATMLAPSWTGLPFLGFLIFRGTIRVRPESLRRIRRRLNRRRHQWRTGSIDDDQLIASVSSVAAHLAHASTLRLRRDMFEDDHQTMS